MPYAASIWSDMYQSVWGPVWGDIGDVCNVSYYYDGTTLIAVPFVYRAPLHMDQDGLMVTTVDENDLKIKSWVSELVSSVDFSVQDASDRYYYHSNTTTSELFIVRFNSLSQDITVFMRDSLANVFFDEDYNIISDSLDTLDVTFDQPTSTIKVFVDGVEIDSQVIVIVADFKLNEYEISYHNDVQHMEMLLYSYELTGIGKADFVSNQDDGKIFISDNGTIWDLTEDVAGSSQIKADGTSSTGYDWGDNKKAMPATGPINLSNDNLFCLFGDRNLVGQNWGFKLVVTENNLLASQYLFTSSPQGSSAKKIEILIDGGGTKIQYRVFDGAGAFQVARDWFLPVGAFMICASYYSGVWEFTVTDSSLVVGSGAEDFSNAPVVGEFNLGNFEGISQHCDAKVSLLHWSLVDTFDLKKRILEQGNPNNSLITGAGNTISGIPEVITITDGAPVTALLPYKEDTFLVNDLWQTQTACITVPAGFKPVYDTKEKLFVFDTEEQQYVLEEL